MTSSFSVNKGLEEPASGDYVNAWATPVNANWTAIDAALGGTTSISVTSISAPTTTLTLTQYRPPNIEFSGILGASLTYQIPTGIGGMWSVSNATTGAFTLSFSIVSGNSLVLQTGRTLLISDGVTVSLANPAPPNISPPTPQEQAAGITPPNQGYSTLPMADVRRYGVVADGVTDDTAALQTACNVASASGLALVLPYGYSVKITSYVQIPSNFSLVILGTLQLTNRAAGLFANNASNINVIGEGIGVVTDTTVSGNYIWNNNNIDGTVQFAPAFHFRSCNNIKIEGINLKYVNWGTLFSNATTTQASNNSPYVLTQTPDSENCSITGCNIQFTEMSSTSCYNGVGITYENNYVYRAGDGGIWMMGIYDGRVVNCTHESPATDFTQVALHGSNNPAFPATWNDEQGVEFENCHGLLIDGCITKNMWGFGVDVKNGCNRVLVTNCDVLYTENASYIVREGDGVKNACSNVSFINNRITNHGTTQYNQPIANANGGIVMSSLYTGEVINNIFYSYRASPGIVCSGPGNYMGSQFPSDPHQASVTVRGNCFNFKNSSFENETPALFLFDSNTPTAILIQGAYDSVLCDDNHIRTDYFLSADGRANPNSGIVMAYISFGGVVYPTACSVSGNVLEGGWSTGIIVAGIAAAVQSGLKVNCNNISNMYSGSFISLQHTSFAVCNDNNCQQVNNNPPGVGGIEIAGTAGSVITGVTCCNNFIGGSWSTGANAMAYGIRFDFANECKASFNTINNAATANVFTANVIGNINLTGTTGYPRSGSGSPNGSVTSNFFGEQYFDNGGHWWQASAAQSIVWTQLS